MERPELGAKFVARSHEATILKAAIQKAIEGVGSTLLISGEAGIGKTRLALELQSYAKSRNMKVLSGRAVPHNFTPYLVFADALEEFFAIERKDDSSTRLRKITNEIERATPEAAEAIPIIDDMMKAALPATDLGIKGWLKMKASVPATDLGIKEWLKGPGRYREFEIEPLARREKLFDSVTRLVLRSSSAQPILIVLDDLQWADPSSLGLLHYLARNIRSAHALMLATYRIEELEGVEERQTLVDTLHLMRAEDLVEEIELHRLAKSEVKELLSEILHIDPPDDFVKIVHSETQGNPLFVIETAKLLVEEQFFVRADGSWRLSKPLESLAIPRKVREVITRRLVRLTTVEREVMDCASVVGDSFESFVLEKAIDLDRTKLLRALSTIDRKYRLIRYSDGLYHFDHTLIREVLYEGLNEELRRQYHLHIAEELETLHDGDLEPFYSILAHHYMKAGLGKKSFLYHVRSAESASQKYANEEAIFHLTAALGLVEVDSPEKARILEQLGDLLQVTGKFSDAIRSWRQATSIYQISNGKGAAGTMHRKIGLVLGTSLGKVEEALNEYETARELLIEAKDERGLAQLYQSHASLDGQRGDFERARKWCELAISLSERNTFTSILAKSYNTLGIVLLQTGQIDAGLEYLDKGLRLALSEELNDTAIDIYNNLGVTFETQGEFLKASMYFERGLQLAKKAGHLSDLPWLHDGLATTYLHSGNIQRALEAAESAVSLDRSQGQFRHLALALCSTGKIGFRLGKTNQAKEAFEEALKLGEQADDHQALVESCVGLGEVALRLEDFGRAKVLLLRASELIERTGDPRLAGKVFPVLATLHIRTGDVHSSKDALAQLETAAERSKSPAVAAVASRMWGQFYAMIGEWEKCFENFSKSLHLYKSVEQPHEHAETVVQLALARRKRGTHEDLREARELLSHAIGIFEGLHEWEEVRRVETEMAKIPTLK